MNHTQAQQLIQAAADGLISEANRRALEHHLAGCRQCQVYADDLSSFEARLSQGLQARWQNAQPRRFTLDRTTARAAGRRESPGLKRLYHVVAVPAFQFGALAVLAVGLIVLIGSAASSHLAALNGSETPTAATRATPAGTLSNVCAAVANIDASVYHDHDSASPVVGALTHGETAPVQAYFLDAQTNQVWLQIEYHGGLAWVTNVDALLTGDCSHVTSEGLVSPTAPTVTAIPAATVTASPTHPPAPVATSRVCDLVAPSPQTMYGDATLEAPIVGSWPAGASAHIIAWAHNGLPPAWFLIRYNNVTGWVWAPWYDPASGSPCSDLPLTAWPTLAPSPTTTSTPTACVVAPSSVDAADHNVYAGPATSYPVLGTVPTGVYVTATGVFSPENYGSWVRVDLNGVEGWVDAGAWMFGGGGCWPLPQVDFQPHPPTFTPSPTNSGPTPTASDTPTPGVGPTGPAPLEFGWSVPGDIGATQTLTGTFPSQGNASPTHHLIITVTGIPQGDGNDSRRVVDFTLTCSGSGNLKWGWASSPGTFGCGDTTRSNGLLWSANTVQFLIQATMSGADTLTYTMTVSFSAYPG